MKMAREGRLRKLHRRDWPGFLSRMLPPALWQGLAREVPVWGDVRTRWTVKGILLAWILMAWSLQPTMGERFRESWQTLAQLFWRRRRAGRSYQSLVKASARHQPEAMRRFWACLRQDFPRRLQRGWLWYGWTLIAVDGTRVDAPRTRANERALGVAGRAGTHPQWWVTLAIHLPSALIWDWRQGRGNSSERTHLQQMIPDLPPSTLVVADAGFGGFDLLTQLSKAAVHFLVRCGGNTTLLVEGTRQQIEQQGEHRYVYLWPLDCHRAEPLRLRLIVLKRRGQRVYLLTSVLESTRLSRSTAGEFYRARWGIEVEYRGLKQTLGHRGVLAKTSQAGAFELAGCILGLGLLMLHGALALGARVVELSVAGAWRVIRWAMEALYARRSSGSFLERMRGARKDRYTRHGSKRARDWPHKKREHPPDGPKLRRPTRRERAAIHALPTPKHLVPG